MKIVVCSDLYYPMINGVAQFTRNLAVGLVQEGHDVLVLTPSLDGDFKIVKEEGVDVVRLPSFKFPFFPDQIEKLPQAREIFGKKIPRIAYKNGLHVSFNPYPEIKKVLDEFKPDIIHNQTPGPVALATYRYARKRDIPIVATGHAYPDNVTGNFFRPWYMKPVKIPVDYAVRKYFARFLTRAEYATMPTKIAINDLMPKHRNGKHKVPVVAMSNGVNLSRFAKRKANPEIIEKYGLPKSGKIVMYLGRVDREKSVDVLVRSFAIVAKKNPDARLVIVGDGVDMGRVKSVAEEVGVTDKTTFTGRIIGDELPLLYNVADMFAITSKTETQSIVLMEAMASGLPCVAVNAGAVRELVKNGKNGFLRRPDDVNGIALAILRILSDSKMRAKMSKESLKLAEMHDIEHTLKMIEGIYERVLAAEKK